MADKKINCCQNCQIFWTCDTKWYRGEKKEQDLCCARCNYYLECQEKLSKKSSPNDKTN